ncbi:hypothetical protein ACEZCY_33755 [Streptacidiphilus sp. N1-12]|uniref:Uncharacterized protein n=2 Tax=Streptacidiphilus alkalitolerans TaxID=3342712 RepID=A0ABV6WQ16_9ACTN
MVRIRPVFAVAQRRRRETTPSTWPPLVDAAIFGEAPTRAAS